jgi:hypothetical protein
MLNGDRRTRRTLEPPAPYQPQTRNPVRAGRCEERWLPGPTVAPISRGGRGQRTEQSDAGLVPFTTIMSFLSHSIRGVSCLPGARPGGCATLECEGRPAAETKSMEPLWRRSSASAPAVFRHSFSKMSHISVSVSIFRSGGGDGPPVCRDAWGASGRGGGLRARVPSSLNSCLSRY